MAVVGGVTALGVGRSRKGRTSIGRGRAHPAVVKRGSSPFHTVLSPDR